MDKNFFEYKNSFEVNKATPSIPIFENRKQDKPRVTIAIPTYKRVPTLIFAVQSALSQDYDDYEIVVLDNNPERDDETEKFMLQFKDKPGFSYFKNGNNIGLFGNWNRCFEMADGKWVSLLHDDDYYFPEYVSTMMRYLDKYPHIQGLYCHLKKWYQDKEKEEIDVIDYNTNHRQGVVKVLDYMMQMAHVVGPVGIFYKRQNVIELGGYNADLYPIADYSFNWRYQKTYGVHFLNTSLVHYRIGINVSIKPETIEKQEYMNLEIKKQDSSSKRFKHLYEYIAKGILYYNLGVAQKISPNYPWKKSFDDNKNMGYWLWRILIAINKYIYEPIFRKKLE